MNRPLIANAFRVLSLAADADSREIYRQQQRLQNAMELGDPNAIAHYKFLPDLSVEPELLLDAVHRLENQRLSEELFWIHDLGGKFDLKLKTANEVFPELRTTAGQKTCEGAVARHNLAVILTCLARELSGLRRFEYWKEALFHWQQTLDGETFWQFMADRAQAIPGAPQAGVDDLRKQAKSVLQAAIADEVWSAIENRDYAAIRLATQLVLAHRTLPDAEATLNAIAEKLIKDGSVAIGGVFDRIAGVTKGSDPYIIRNALVASEHEILRISNDYAETLKALGPGVASGGWNDARAMSFEQLSVAYFNVLHDSPEALRLLVEAQKLGDSVELMTRLTSGWKHVQRDVLCKEGLKLAQTGDVAAAEEKFASALSLCTQEQRPEVEELLESCRRRRLFGESGQSPILRTLNGIGTTLYGKRDFDSKSNTYAATQWFVLWYLPIFPIAAYRVRYADGSSYYVYGRLPLSPFLKRYRVGVILAVLVLAIVFFSSQNGPTSSHSPQNGVSDAVPGADSQGHSRDQERQALDAERDALESLASDLGARKQQLDKERMDLEGMKMYLDMNSHGGPLQGSKDEHDSTITQYNRKAPAFNKKLKSFQSDIQELKRRKAAFNARVERFNSNQ